MSQVRRMAYLLVIIFAAALLTSKVWSVPRPPKFIGVASAEVPHSVAGYTAGKDLVMPPEVTKALGSGDVIERAYEGGGAVPIDFVLIGGTDRSALHDPRSCLVGAGWRLENDHTEAIPGANIAARSCRAVGNPNGPSQDMLYVYVVDGKIIDSPTQIRFAMLKSALIGQQGTPVYFLRFMCPLDTNEANAEANHASMQAFAKDMWESLKQKVSKT
ncbi:MAG: exosortase-associated EpsI family protein [Capsulimonas sp.]|uniref:exosortase-associated EpsI family protein n=1 Tax=Capsulimonas sp. TaxID=2494211 RepID=UPI0032679AF6